MRPILATLILLGTALAMPAVQQFAPPANDCCCCCDIAKGAISCVEGIPKSQCVCAAVVCPANAPTIFPGVAPTPRPVPQAPPVPRPAPPPQLPQLPWWFDLLTGANSGAPKSDCCCCNIAIGAISCTKQSGICICPAVVCPVGAPTVWPNGDGPVQTPVIPGTKPPTLLPTSPVRSLPIQTALPLSPLLSLLGRELPAPAA